MKSSGDVNIASSVPASSVPTTQASMPMSTTAASSITTTSGVSTTTTSSVENGTMPTVTSATVTQTSTCSVASSPSNNLLHNNNKNEKGLPKAMIKPNILTHVIGDFVIQESKDPFPVTRQRYADDTSDQPPSKYNNFI